MKKGICMVLTCVECKKRVEIEESKMDSYNIYHAGRVGQDGYLKVDMKPNLLCRKCTNAAVRKVRDQRVVV